MKTGLERRRLFAINVGVQKSASSDQYSTGTNASITRSRSTTIRSAAVCTRPAERPRFTFFQSNGLTL